MARAGKSQRPVTAAPTAADGKKSKRDESEDEAIQSAESGIVHL